jgi:hypothetical protein
MKTHHLSYICLFLALPLAAGTPSGGSTVKFRVIADTTQYGPAFSIVEGEPGVFYMAGDPPFRL